MAKKPYTEEHHPLVGHVRSKFQQGYKNRAILGGKLLLGNIKYLIKSSIGKK